MKIITIVGARPQIIKAAALSREINLRFPGKITELIVHTGQHYDDNMSEVFFREMMIPKPAVNLGVGSSAHGEQTARMLSGIEAILLEERPKGVVVYGDTNSTIAAAIAAVKIHIPVFHVEAGLRSFNKNMPEEINRIVTDHCSTLMFCPTRTAVKNLENEGFLSGLSGPYHAGKPGVFHCGDIMFDNSMYFSTLAAQQSSIIQKLNVVGQPYILATIHRNDNTDHRDRLHTILEAIYTISVKNRIPVFLPLHPRTVKMINEWNLLPLMPQGAVVHILQPVSFFDMIQLEQNCSLIITDSGGVQKEAYFFRKPSLILRPETEWVEILEVKAARLGGNSVEDITGQAETLLNNPPIDFPPVFGDGHAASFICETMLRCNG